MQGLGFKTKLKSRVQVKPEASKCQEPTYISSTKKWTVQNNFGLEQNLVLNSGFKLGLKLFCIAFCLFLHINNSRLILITFGLKLNLKLMFRLSKKDKYILICKAMIRLLLFSPLL